MKAWACGLWLCMWVCGPTTVAQTTIQRDQQALTIIAQIITAGGGQDALLSIQDITASGTVTYYGADQTTGNATIKSRGSNQFRLDADLPAGRRTTVVTGNSGELIDADGSFLPISRQNALDLGSIAFPYKPLISALQDSSISIFYIGLVDHNGASAYDIRIQNTYTSNQDPHGTRGAREARDFYIDSNSFVVLSISDELHFGAEDNGIAHEIDYSNYQVENGVLMPLGVADNVNGAIDCSITIQGVIFNSGLTDADFLW